MGIYTNLIDPIGLGKNEHLHSQAFKEFASKKMMIGQNYSQYVPLQTGWPLENDGMKLWGWNFPRNFPTKG